MRNCSENSRLHHQHQQVSILADVIASLTTQWNQLTIQFDCLNFVQGLELTQYHQMSKATFLRHNVFWYCWFILLFCDYLSKNWLFVCYSNSKRPPQQPQILDIKISIIFRGFQIFFNVVYIQLSHSFYNLTFRQLDFVILLCIYFALRFSIYARPHKLHSFYYHRAKIKAVCLSVCLSVCLLSHFLVLKRC